MRRIIFISYFLFLLLLTIFSYAFIDPNLFYLKKFYTGFAFNNKPIVTGIYILFTSLFFIFYFLFLKYVKEKKLSIKKLKMIIGMISAIVVLSYPAILSYDIFNYFSTSKVLYFYKENPYLIMPIEFTGDSFLLFTRAANKIALYGPSWIALTSLPFLAGFDNFFLIILNFKLLALVFYLMTIFLIFKITKNLFSVSLFALNPLIILETLTSGHNDIVMMFLSVLSFFFLMNKKIFFGAVALFLAILIKYSALLLLPVFIYTAFKMLKKEKIDWSKIFYFSTVLMFLAFFLSPIREEIYPWYAIWFLTFSFLIPERKFVLNLSLVFSFSLLFRYVPYMFSGTYLGYTPILKTAITFIPPALFSVYYVFKKNI